MNKEIDGFVIYNRYKNKNKIFGVVSNDYECNAKSSNIPSKIKEFIIPIEDKRFYKHYGIDFRGISRALLRNFINLKVLEGGSTISQQLARNLLRDNNKTIKRKLRETIKAINLERNFSKEEILNLYFDNVYFGKNMRGIRIASLHYFEKEPEKLNRSEILYLITILRGPNYYVNNADKTYRRMRLLSNLLYQNQNINQNQLTKINRKKITPRSNVIIPINMDVIPYIVENINFNKKTIESTLNQNFQNFANQIVRDSKYPLSVVIIKNKKVVGFSSHYGSDYPFIFKSNVGSTLKPFLFYLAKKVGIDSQEKFNAYKNNLNWDVREVTWTDNKLNLEEALFYSNNNSFINIVDKIGLEKSLDFLSKTLNIPLNELFPSSVLGATKNGISLYQLALFYNQFLSEDIDEEKQVLMKVLNRIFKSKINIDIENVFLKTGTTNDNDERLAIIHQADITFAYLRNENPVNDYSKDGNFLKQIKDSLLLFFKTSKEHKWIS